MFKTEFVDFNSFFELQLRFFKIVGIRFDLSEPRKDSVTTKWINLIYCIITYISYVVHVLLLITHFILSDILEDKISVFPNIYAHVAAFTNFYIIFKNLGKLENILKLLKEQFENQQMSEMVDREKFLRQAKFICNLSKFFNYFSPSIFVIPLITTYS